MIHHLTFEGKEIILIGTAHVSRQSAEEVTTTITEEKPDTVSVELCESRYTTLTQKDQWRNTDIFKVVKEKKAFVLLAHLLLASFQKRIAKKLNIRPGEEMLRAIEAANEQGAHIHLADRDIRTTLARTWRSMTFWNKLKLSFQMLLSIGEADDISAEEVEKMKEQDMLASVLDELGKSQPVIKRVIISERDQYLAQRIRTAPGEKIVAVVGAGHVPGILDHWEKPIDIEKLKELPPKQKFGSLVKWILPIAILALFGYGFIHGAQQGTQMVTWWVVANGVLAGVGALCALGHPLTILASVLAAPLTSLNPMIAAGWVSGLVEAVTRKPKVKDLETLQQDIVSIKGFWKNKVTRILLVVVFTNLGSMAGTFIALPMMLKIMAS